MIKRNESPNIECPLCGRTFRVDDPAEIDQGVNVECPHCEATLVVVEVDFVAHWYVMPANESW